MKSKTGWVMLLLLFSCFTIQLSRATSQGSQTIASYGSIVSNVITYFQSSFAYEGLEPYSKGDWWPTWEPCGYPIEKGIWHWVVVNRPKEPCGGNMRLIDDPADPTRLCLEMVLNYEGTRPVTDTQDVKLYELQHLEPENYPEPYPTAKEAYYRFKVWFPKDWAEAQDWKLIWQICGEYGVYGTSTGHWSPQMSLSFVAPFWGYGDALVFSILDYYYTDGQTRRWKIIDRSFLPNEKWVTFDIYVKQGSAFQSEDGTVIIWIDGGKVFERHNLPVATPSETPYVVWGIGNYGSKFEPYGQRILFKDVIVSSELASFA